jgi:hypothetical protein
MRGHRLGESELTSEDRRDANLVRLDVHVGGDNRTCSIVYSFTLGKVSCERYEGETRWLTIMFFRNRPSFFSSNCLTPEGGSFP